MKARTRTFTAFCFVLLCAAVPRPGCAQNQSPDSLTLEQALNRARLRAPSLLSARARIDEARGRVTGASIALQSNPTIEGTAGPRFSEPSRFTAADVAVGQDFEALGRRSARIAGAKAGVNREMAASEEVSRQLLREVASLFYRALAATDKLKVLTNADQIATEFLSTADKRYQAGDIPILEVNVARTGSARSRSALLSGRAELADALGDLRVLLGIPADEKFIIAGNLKDLAAYDLDALMRTADDRPDVRVLESELQQALSDTRLGNTFKSPDIGAIARYQRDQGDNIAQIGLRVTLPIFSRGQELIATGNARAVRLRAELEASKVAIHTEIKSALEVYTNRVAAAQELERRALPGLDENETLTQRSYAEGELGLAELLLIRRESLETRLSYVSALLDAALENIDLQSKAGVLK
jgi:outer membrane protein, heavy metal efflux system